MRKLLKSKKALSPVVAAIILIAVTVAVSIAVAAWMGSLTIGLMENKEITITQMTFVDDDVNDAITVYLTNSGTSDVTIALVKVNGNTITTEDPDTDGLDWTMADATVPDGADATLTIAMDVTAGNKYLVNLFTSDGTMVGSYTDTA